MIDSWLVSGQIFALNTMSTLAIGFISMTLLAPSMPAQQKPILLRDPSRITDAPEFCSGSGKKNAGQQKRTLRIPVGDRLDDVFMTSSNWITGISFRLADGKDRLWGNLDDHHDHTHKLKDEEYIVGVRVHTDIRVDWIDLITSQKRILHFGPSTYGTSNLGMETLNIPAQSRVIGLSLYTLDRKPPEIQRVEALYQAAN